jgi:hypothetical protein
MKTVWTSHLKNEKEAELFKNSLLGSKYLFERQADIINDRLKAIDLIETSVDLYKQPGWEGLLAHYRGEVRALKWVKNLIDLETPNDRTIPAGQQQRASD